MDNKNSKFFASSIYIAKQNSDVLNKFSPGFLAVFFCAFFISCSGDNLYEFDELSKKEDFIIQLVVIPEDPTEKFDFQTVFFKTDGFGQILKHSIVYKSAGEYKLIRKAVKEYKKVGVTIIPNENVSRVEVRIYNLLFNDDVFWQSFENIESEITVSYDFELEQEEIIIE